MEAKRVIGESKEGFEDIVDQIWGKDFYKNLGVENRLRLS